MSEKVTGVNLVPVPLADCQPLVSRAAAATSKLAEPWEKLCRFVCSLPARTSIPSEAPAPAWEHSSVPCPAPRVAFLSRPQALETVGAESHPLRDCTRTVPTAALQTSFSSVSPWRGQATTVGQSLSFYRELIEGNVERRCSVFFC